MVVVCNFFQDGTGKQKSPWKGAFRSNKRERDAALHLCHKNSFNNRPVCYFI